MWSQQIYSPKVLPRLPALLGLYGKALIKSENSDENYLPSLSVSVPEVRANVRRAHSYDRLCHFPDSQYLAPTYLHVLAFPLHIYLATEPAMPLNPVGLVHIRNQLRLLRPVAPNEVLHITCFVGEWRTVAAGLEFDIVTHIDTGSERIYEGVSAYLRRDPSPTRKRTNLHRRTPHELTEIWQLSPNLGREYGALSGDRNPIHLWPVTAQMFGFKRPIIHGMWSMARCLAALMPKVNNQPFVMDVSFKMPIFLPSSVKFSYDDSCEQLDFLLTSANGRAHLIGDLKQI